MTFIPSYVPSPGYPPNAVGAVPMTKIIAEENYDSQRPEIADAKYRRENPSKPSYTWPIIGLITSTIATAILCNKKFK